MQVYLIFPLKKYMYCRMDTAGCSVLVSLVRKNVLLTRHICIAEGERGKVNTEPAVAEFQFLSARVITKMLLPALIPIGR